jgi:hypothetical protein
VNEWMCLNCRKCMGDGECGPHMAVCNTSGFLLIGSAEIA